MQEKIPPFPPSKIPGMEKDAAPKASKALFSQITDVTWLRTKTELLLEALSFLNFLNTQDQAKAKEASKSAKEAFALPKDEVTEKVLRKAELIKNLHETLKETRTYLEKDDKRALQSFMKSAELVENRSLQTHLQHLLKDHALNSLLFKTSLAKTVIAAEKGWGSDQGALAVSILQKLQQMAGAKPPSLFSQAAQKMLSDQAALSSLTQNPSAFEKELLAALKSENQKTALSQTLEALNASMTARGMYASYLTESEQQAFLAGIQKSTEHFTTAANKYLDKVAQILKKGGASSELTQLLKMIEEQRTSPDEHLKALIDRLYAQMPTLIKEKLLPPHVQKEFLDQTEIFLANMIKNNEEEGLKALGKATKEHSKIAALSKQSVSGVKEKCEILQKKSEGYKRAEKFLNEHTEETSQALTDVKLKKLMSVGDDDGDGDYNIPNGFANIVINKYMPWQEAQMLAMAGVLNFFNGANSGLLQGMSDLSGWSSPSANYASGTWFNSTLVPGSNPPTYNTTVQAAQAQINTENSVANGDLVKNQNAINAFQQQIAANSPPTTPAQQALVTKLQGYITNLNQAQAHLQVIIADTSPQGTVLPWQAPPSNIGNGPNFTTITNPSPPPDTQVQISSGTTQEQFTSDESTLLNGASDNPGSGLAAIYSQVSGDQGFYSGLSQQSQLQLQLVMTQTQQQWSLVSSCMQTMTGATNSVIANIRGG